VDIEDVPYLGCEKIGEITEGRERKAGTFANAGVEDKLMGSKVAGCPCCKF